MKAVWHRPTTLRGMLDLKKNFPDMKIIVGNSEVPIQPASQGVDRAYVSTPDANAVLEVAIERLFKNALYPVLVSPTHVPGNEPRP